MEKGWIRLHRKLQESEIWNLEPFTKGQAWVDMILMANHKPKSFFLRGNEVKVGRGQIARGEVSFSEKWGWSRGKVRRYFSWLETRQQIIQQKSKLISIITITNYNEYQLNETIDSTTDSTTDGHEQECKECKEVKKGKGKKKKFTPPDLQEVKDYFKVKGYTEKSAEKAFDYYDQGDWIDSQGNPVRSWKQKMISVWFKPENKEPKKAGSMKGECEGCGKTTPSLINGAKRLCSICFDKR